MAKKEIPILENYHNCRQKPRCQLAISAGWHRPTSIQIHGAPAIDVRNRYRNYDNLFDSYSIFVVGEAPGRFEDSLGLPFVGEAGELLLNLLEAAGIPLLNTFLTNITRCRPPKNRNPSAPEIRACLTHLYFEIKKFQPKVIVLTGAIPLKLFNLKGGIGNLRGQIFEKKLPFWQDGPAFHIIPTYHPAFLLRKDETKLNKRVIDDLRIAKELSEGKKPKSTFYKSNYQLCETVEQVKDAVVEIKEHGRFAFDTESPDLNFRTSPMIMMQMSCGEARNWVIPFYKHDPDSTDEFKLKVHFDQEQRREIKEALAELYEDPEIIKYAQNTKYDANVIRAWLGLEYLGDQHDVSLMHHLLDCYPPHGLKYLSDVEFMVGPYSSEIEEVIGGSEDKVNKTWDNIPDDIFWQYGATDAEVTYRLAELYLEKIKRAPRLYQLYKDEVLPCCREFQDAEWVGNKIHLSNLKKLEEYFIAKLAESEARARRFGGEDFNPHSHKQVKEVLIKLGFDSQIADPYKATKYSTDKETLLGISHPIAEAILDCRTYKKRLSTYITRIKENLEDDGCIRYGYRIHGTVSGRQSNSLLHQVPRNTDNKDAGAAIRDIFTEDEGFSMVYADFSQLELRIFAYVTGDKKLIKALDQDVHAANAAACILVKPEEVSEFNRSNLGKPMSFGGIFGSAGTQLSKCKFENPISGKVEIVGWDRAEQFVKNLHATYPSVGKYLHDTPLEALANGCVVESVFGRRRRLPDLTSKMKGVRKAAEREAVNFTIQSPASSITTRTINHVGSILRKNKIGLDKIRFRITVHDSIVYGVKNSLVDWFSIILKRIAERPIPQISNKSFPIALGVGDTWAAAEKASK